MTATFLTIAQGTGCRGPLLPPAYLHQDYAPPTADPTSQPVMLVDRTKPASDPVNDPKNRTDPPVRLYACQNTQTHEVYWAPEYRFTPTDRTELFELDFPTPPPTIVVNNGSFPDALDVAAPIPPPVAPTPDEYLRALPSWGRRDRGLQLCSIIEERSRKYAVRYEVGGFVMAGVGAAGTAALAFAAVATAAGAPTTTANGTTTGMAPMTMTSTTTTTNVDGTKVGLLAAGAGLSALITVAGAYLVGRGADSWGSYGGAQAAILQMQPNNSDANATLCSTAVQAWTTGRSAASSVSGGGGGGGGKGGAGAGGGGSTGGGGGSTGGGASTSAQPAAGLAYPACPSDLNIEAINQLGLYPSRPPTRAECGPLKGSGTMPADLKADCPATGDPNELATSCNVGVCGYTKVTTPQCNGETDQALFAKCPASSDPTGNAQVAVSCDKNRCKYSLAKFQCGLYKGTSNSPEELKRDCASKYDPEGRNRPAIACVEGVCKY